MQIKLVFPLFLILSAVITHPVSAQKSLGRHVFGSGAADITGSGKWLRGTLGQPVAGSTSDVNYTGSIGFWWIFAKKAVTGIGDPPMGLEFQFRLLQNFPNPVLSHTTIRFDLAAVSRVKLQLFDVQGRLVGTFVDQELPAGEHSVYLRPVNLAPGLYWYRLEAGTFKQQRRFVVIN